MISQERARVDAMQLENEENSGVDLSLFDNQADQHLAGKLFDQNVEEEEEEELRIRRKNLSQDLFSEMSSVASPHQSSIFSPPLQAVASPEVELTPANYHSLLGDDLNL